MTEPTPDHHPAGDTPTQAQPPPPTPSPTTKTKRSSGPKPTDETIRETLESIIIAFALAFVFRAYVVEAFVIPTGSMAPSLMGQHTRVQCEMCGYRFTVDSSDSGRLGNAEQLTCPMCFNANNLSAGTRTQSGDRILVQKYIYSLAEPKRWDVVVFKNPRHKINRDGTPGPRQNYIKRLVGLPNEQLALLDGNIYTKPDGQPWQIARKTDPDVNPRWEKIQRAVWQPIYHSQYIPLDRGQPQTPANRDRFGRNWRCPWVADSGQWKLDNRRTYRLAIPDAQNAGTIRFRFQPPEGSNYSYADKRIRYTYDQKSTGFRSNAYHSDQAYLVEAKREPIEDIRLAAVVSFDRPDAAITLASTARLDAEPQTIKATLHSDGRVELLASDTRLIEPTQTQPIQPGQAVDFELWHVDQTLLVWVNGREVLRYHIDLDWESQVIHRPLPLPVPELAIHITGGPATLHNVQLDRDLFYDGHNDNNVASHGAFQRRRADNIAAGQPHTLNNDEFFVIGDNGPISDDARFWKKINRGQDPDVHPWVEKLMFANDGMPHQGKVPRRLMIGRAFFVYYPAPFSLSPAAPGVFPNFGQMRFIR